MSNSVFDDLSKQMIREAEERNRRLALTQAARQSDLQSQLQRAQGRNTVLIPRPPVGFPQQPMQTSRLNTSTYYKFKIPLSILAGSSAYQYIARTQQTNPQLFGIEDSCMVLSGDHYIQFGRIDNDNDHYGAIFNKDGIAQTAAFKVNTDGDLFFPIDVWDQMHKKPVEKGKVKFDSVVVDKHKVDQIREAISQRKNQELIFTTWGFSEVFEKGTAVSLLFYGIPGTGKTLMAQAIADDLGMELKVIGAADIQTSEPGGAERRIQAVFKEAGEKTIILLDECDSLLIDRNMVGHIMASQINTLLSAIEHFKGVVIFTTNRLGRLDPALERRIAAKIEFVFPDKKAREKIWERMIPKKAPLADDVDFKRIAEYPLTGGNIKNAVLNAARKAAYRELKEIDQSCFVEAVEKEMEAIQEFASNKQDTYRQGNMIASRDQNIVEGDFGEAVNQIEAFTHDNKH